ncbi:glycoside hydrolase family 1 protein [Aggregicoccus sp. 17bor-14]|uniref:glycoside hydrolase family 1 protein n=1 Tax=Myxococcaceae TaxID=31 RepID=UPI00129C41A1|nr:MULTISPECIES: family 1 glycosylhydrolase [Myxococcaceae]MBF5042388.1 glycoside hydrolase family 1 protein [Simulacricoccus sp. 17bor-14]MRI88160.1 glycoside hydrolase family 1 protein [Aggregicoccus sp. 17bor-14]
MPSETTRFPDPFTFGVATSAYQVEGGIENDWSAWERAGRLKEPHMRCGRAVDHWRRYREDYRLAREVGARAFRLSLEWARIEPEPGRFDGSVLEGYRERLLALKAEGLRPVVTLHHFTHPTWFHARSPWHRPESIPAFRAYARVCARLLEGLDALVISFNEPMVLLLGGYLQGLMPPGLQDAAACMQALENLVRAHVAAREELGEVLGRVELGISQNLLAFAPDRRWHPLDRALVRLGAHAYNHALLEALSTGKLRVSMPGVARARADVPGAQGSCAFVGVNYYTRAHLRFLPQRPFLAFRFKDPRGRGLTDIGWEQHPEGLGQLLREVQRYGLPIWVTENGIDDRTGTRRPHYLHAHLAQVLGALRDGVDVRGYLHWSLLDNFEWLEGWGPRFGLYRVDFDTLERHATPACGYFRQVSEGRVLVAP